MLCFELQFTFGVHWDAPQPYRIHPSTHSTPLYHIKYNNNRTNRNYNLLLVGWFASIAWVYALCFGSVWISIALCAAAAAAATDTVATHLPPEFDQHLYLRFISKWQWWCNNADDDTNENQVSPSEYFITVIIWPIVYHVLNNGRCNSVARILIVLSWVKYATVISACASKEIFSRKCERNGVTRSVDKKMKKKKKK